MPLIYLAEWCMHMHLDAGQINTCSRRFLVESPNVILHFASRWQKKGKNAEIPSLASKPYYSTCSWASFFKFAVVAFLFYLFSLFCFRNLLSVPTTTVLLIVPPVSCSTFFSFFFLLAKSSTGSLIKRWWHRQWSRCRIELRPRSNKMKNHLDSNETYPSHSLLPSLPASFSLLFPRKITNLASGLQSYWISKQSYVQWQ